MHEAVTRVAVACHVCGVADVDEIVGYAELYRVTSDCKPWRRGGRLATCRSCGCVQKPIDDAWRADAASIYEQYAIYHQARGGVEQAVFDGVAAVSSRSQRLIARLRAELGLASTGRLLDLGCGNGPFLRAFSAAAPEWVLTGADVGEASRSAIEAIPCVEGFYGGGLAGVPGNFDLAVMVHALEHVADPAETLRQLRRRLAPSGRLLLQLPSHAANPFELAVADHASHFTAGSVRRVVESAGFEVERVADDWLPRELTVVARPGHGVAAAAAEASAGGAEARSGVGWLREVARDARVAAAARPLGVFGTSIAGTWLAAELEGAAAFFVDEDPNRVGIEFLGRPVLDPASLERGSLVYVALPPGLTARVASRLTAAGAQPLLPPALA